MKQTKTIDISFDSVSPITNNRCVVEEANEQDNTVSFLCMESGFTTHEKLIEGSEFQEKYESSITSLMTSCKFVDNGKRAWYPTFMRTPFAMLFIEGKTKNTFIWKVAPIVPILGEDRLKYPVAGKENEYHTSRLDVENAKTYDKDDFKNALDEMYSLVKKEYTDED